MDPATVNAIITGSAGLLGALVGAGSANLASWIQHKRDAKSKRIEERRTSEHDAAKKCEELCVRIADNMESVRHPSQADNSQIQRIKEKSAREAHTGLIAATLYLPTDLRERMELLGNIAYQADDMAFGDSMNAPTHYDSPYTICWNVKREIRALTASFLQSEDLPSPGAKIIEYKAALVDLDEQRREFYEMIEEDDQAAKRRVDTFYKSHPELAPKRNELSE